MTVDTFNSALIERRYSQLPLDQARCNGTLLAVVIAGGVVEWFMAPVLKTGRPKGLVGSNPTPSAISFSIFDFRFSIARQSKPSFEHDARGSASGRLHSRSGSWRTIGRSRDQYPTPSASLRLKRSASECCHAGV